MIKKRSLIAFIGFITIHVISYFAVLPIAQKLANQHNYKIEFVLVYVGLIIILPFIFYRLYKKYPDKIFLILIFAIMLSLIIWCIKLLLLECVICSMAG